MTRRDAGVAPGGPPAVLPDDAWFAAVDLRAELGAVRAGIAARLAAGVGCADVVRALAARDPLAAAELLLGPRATPAVGRLALLVLPALEAEVKPPALYRRLLDLLPERRREVLGAAVDRHPEARWLLALSVRVEGPAAGTLHLGRAARSGVSGAALEALCRRYIVTGTSAGVVALVAAGHLEGLAALAREGAEDALVSAAAAAIEADPSLPVIPTLTAVWGTRPVGLLRRIAERMGDAPGWAAIGPQLAWWPELAHG